MPIMPDDSAYLEAALPGFSRARFLLKGQCGSIAEFGHPCATTLTGKTSTVTVLHSHEQHHTQD